MFFHQFSGNSVIVILVLSLLVPLHTTDVGCFLYFNIILALMIIMVIHSHPHDFLLSIIVLFATVMRLGLNVASTRVVLLEGHQAAMLLGRLSKLDNLLLAETMRWIHCILHFIIINFIVITKGAGRVSEVIVRLILDALLKQLLLTQTQMPAS